MNTIQPKDDFTETQAAIYRVALSLDSFLLNGIPYGVIHQGFFNGFLEKLANILLTELASLEAQAPHAPIAVRPKVTEAVATLRTKCQQLIDRVTGLSSFRIVPLDQLRSLVSQVPLLREACVRQLQELEASFQVPKPFYRSRPSHSTAAVNDFLADLEHVFTREWNDSAEYRVQPLP